MSEVLEAKACILLISTWEPSAQGVSGSTLRELSAKALGLETLDEELFKEKIDHVFISPCGHITFCFYDGHEEAMTYSTKRRMPGWTPERREKQVEAIKASFTEERRQKMSETMKKIRSEKYWASTKAKE